MKDRRQNVWGYMVLGLVCALLMGAFDMALAAALSANRDTPEREGQLLALTQGSNVVYAGSMVAVYTGGTAQAAADASGLMVVGRAEAFQDNTGSTYDSARVLVVRRGVFLWENGGSLTDGDIGQLCYVEDDQTVTTAAEASADIIAGWIVDVDTDGVWVDTRDLGSQGASSVASLTVSGNGTVGGTLAVTGATTLSTVTASGAATLGSTAVVGKTLTVAGNASVGTNLTVAGTSTFTGAVSGSNVTYSGTVALTGIPTTTNGLTTGRLWSNSGALTVY